MDIIDGFKYLVHKKEIFFLVILSALVNFFLSGYNLLIPYTDVVFKEEFTGFYSKILVMEAIGGILGSFISSKIFVELGAKYKILIFFLMLTGISLVLVPLATLTKNIVCCLLPFLAFGTALTIFNINFMSFVQLNVDEIFLGRVFSIIFTVAVLFMPIGSFFFSFVSDPTNIISFMFVGGGIVILSVLSRIFIQN